MRLVIGTRPEAIKLAPVAHALARAGIQPSLIFTGQHALEPSAYDLHGFEAVSLGCRGRADPHAHVEAVKHAAIAALNPRPDLLVVHGDTSSALGAARASVAAGVPLAHVEAGLRSHDERFPWPEEGYRVEIDRLSDLLFAPTSVSEANLQAELLTGEIHVTGNSGVDAALAVARTLTPTRLADGGLPRLLVTCHRRESWESGLSGIAAALREITRCAPVRIELVLHPNPFVADRMRQLVAGEFSIALLEPCSHGEMLQRMRSADLILSDSGGVQEEAPTLGVPLLVLREKTERPEGIAAGNARLVGTGRETIVKEVLELLGNPAALARMRVQTFPYGDGRAAPRIAAIILGWLEQRRTLTYAAE